MKIITQTNNNINIFIPASTQTYQLLDLCLGLLQKKFFCSDQIDVNGGTNVQFTKINSLTKIRNYMFQRKVYNENEIINFSLIKFKDKFTCTIKISPIKIQQKIHDLIQNFLNDLTSSEKVLKEIQPIIIKSSISFIFDDESDKENLKLINNIVQKVKLVEENYTRIYKLIALQYLSKIDAASHFQLNEMEKFIKNELINNINPSSKETRKKFIELCQLFKSNKLINKIKVNNIDFELKINKLKIKIFGITIIIINDIKHTLYFDHIGVNFIIDFIDKNNLISNIERKISTEVFTRM